MKKPTYRIVQCYNPYTEDSTYKVQKRSILGFWYNPNNIDAYATGYFGTLEAAKDYIKSKTCKVQKKVVWTDNNLNLKP